MRTLQHALGSLEVPAEESQQPVVPELSHYPDCRDYRGDLLACLVGHAHFAVEDRGHGDPPSNPSHMGAEGAGPRVDEEGDLFLPTNPYRQADWAHVEWVPRLEVCRMEGIHVACPSGVEWDLDFLDCLENPSIPDRLAAPAPDFLWFLWRLCREAGLHRGVDLADHVGTACDVPARSGLAQERLVGWEAPEEER